MTAGFRQAVVVPTPPTPPPISLLDMAAKPGPSEVDLDGKPLGLTTLLADGRTEQITGYRWEAGFRWLPRQCAPFGARNECAPAAAVNYRNPAAPPVRSHMPVILTAENPCRSALPNDWPFERQSTIDALLAAEAAAAEEELWDGTLARAALAAGDQSYAENYWLARNGIATDLTGGTAVSPQRALGLLEQFLSDTGYGSRGMIHFMPQVLSHLNYDLRPSGSQLYSARNTFIVPGVGYSGLGPSASTTRTVHDASTTSGSKNVTSATAAFIAADVGAPVSGTGIAPGSTITTVTNATTIVVSLNATSTGTGRTLTVAGDIPKAAPTGTCWAYCTDRVVYRQGEVDVIPDDEGQALDRTVNDVAIFAQRSSAATWDTCAVGAVLVALPA